MFWQVEKQDQRIVIGTWAKLRLQKYTDLIIAADLSDQFPYIGFHAGKIIRVHPSFKQVAGKHGQQALQLGNAALCGRIVPGPVFQMFFRPEEKHGTSGVSDIRHPFGYGKGDIADQSFWVGLFDDAVTHFNADGLTTI